MTRKFQIAALSLLAAVSACGSAAQGIYTKSQERLPYRFFRVEADFEIKATGERIRFDYIAWCGGTVTHWRAGSPSIRYNLYPEMMHIPTQDGAAVGIRTFNMCDEWTWENDRDGNSRIPDDLLPMVRWYPDVNDMSFAIGYESDAAYESPYSKLTFLGAKLNQTDAETWAAWRKDYETGFKPVGDIENPYYDFNTPSSIALFCYRASRVPLPPERIEEAEPFIPEGVGRFWPNVTAGRTDAQKQSTAAFKELLWLDAWRYGGNFGGHDLGAYDRTGQWLGAMTRSGGGRVRNTNTAAKYVAYSDVFPVLMSLVDAPDLATRKFGTIAYSVLESDAWNGFSVCGHNFMQQDILEDYSRGKLPMEALDVPQFQDFNWNDDGNSSTEDAWFRRQTVSQNFVGGELVTDDGYPLKAPRMIYDRNGSIYILTNN